MLQSQFFPLPFQTGQDEKTDPRWVEPGAQTSLINAHLARPGSLRKRNGYGVLGGTSYAQSSRYASVLASDTYQRVFPQNNSAALVNGGRLWNLSATKNEIYDLDAAAPLLATRHPLDSCAKAIDSWDCVILGNGLVGVVYCSNSIVYGAFYDPANGGVVAWIPSTTAGDEVRAVLIPGALNANKFWAVVQTNSDLHIHFYIVDSIDTAFHAAGGPVITDCAAAGAYDACSWDGASPPSTFVLVYSQTGHQWRAATINSIGNVTSSASFTPSGINPLTLSMAVRATYGENIWVVRLDDINGLGSNTLTRIMGLDPSALTTTTADTQLASIANQQSSRVGVERVDATHALAVWTGQLSYGTSTSWQQITASSAALGQLRTAQQMALASAPFTLDGKIYAQFVFSSSMILPLADPSAAAAQPAPSAYLVDLLASDSTTVNQAAQLRAVVAPRIVSSSATVLAFVPHVAVSGTTAYTALPVLRSGTDPNGLDLVVYSKSRIAHQAAKLGNCTYLSGGVPCVFDGKRVTEMGFAYNVATVTATVSNTGSMPDATYIYAFVWEWNDAAGQRKQSQPVYKSVVVSGQTNLGSVALTVPCLSLTLGQDSESSWDPKVALAIYRTIPSVATGVYCRIFSSDVPTDVLSVPYGTSSLTHTDTHADTDIENNEQLYTSGGVVPSQCPSSLTCLIEHNGRLVGVGDDEQTIWYTTAWDGGTSQPRFNDSFVLTVPGGGRIKALASMDSTLYVLTKTRIYAISGDGPDETGAGASWSTPRLIPSDVGCDSDWRSVCTTPFGIVFKHGSRLYMLSRGLEVQYWSRPVEQTLASFPVVTSMTFVPEYQQLRITCRTAEGSSSGRILAFDYVANAWSVFNLYDSDAAIQGCGIDSACYVPGQGFVWLGGIGSPWFEQAGSYLDPGSTWISMSVETAWMKPAQVLGFARFRWAQLLAEKNTDADITISIANDYKDTYDETHVITAQDLNDGLFTAKNEIKAHIVNQKSSAVRIKISDGTPTGGTVGTGQGYNMIGLVIEGGVKKGLRKLPQTQGV